MAKIRRKRRCDVGECHRFDLENKIEQLMAALQKIEQQLDYGQLDTALRVARDEIAKHGV